MLWEFECKGLCRVSGLRVTGLGFGVEIQGLRFDA